MAEDGTFALRRQNSYSVDVWTPILATLKREGDQQAEHLVEKYQGADSQEKMQEISRIAFREMLDSAKQFATRHADMMGALWSEYDTNGDNFLQIDELVRMQRHSLQTGLDNLDANIEVAIDGFLEGLESSYKTNSMSEAEYLEVASQRAEMCAAAKAESLPQIEQNMKPEAVEASAKDMWAAMDLNADGVVTKDEFFSMYVAHSSKLVMQQLIEQLDLPVDLLAEVEAEQIYSEASISLDRWRASI